MKVFFILLLAALAGAAGYLFGTQAGRERRQGLTATAHKVTDAAKDTVHKVTDRAKDAAGDTAEHVDEVVDAAADAVDQLAS